MTKQPNSQLPGQRQLTNTLLRFAVFHTAVIMLVAFALTEPTQTMLAESVIFTSIVEFLSDTMTTIVAAG